jgi:hypothetical protein
MRIICNLFCEPRRLQKYLLYLSKKINDTILTVHYLILNYYNLNKKKNSIFKKMYQIFLSA